jgi:RimJ/RimL family protein N-acetyltransferase
MVYHSWRGVWGAVYKAQAQLIGRCALQYLDHTPEVEVSYILAKPYWGMGLATEAVHALVRYGFEEAQLGRLVAVAPVEHRRSHRVMAKVGMQYEGTACYYNTDMARYVITREAYQPVAAPYVLHRAPNVSLWTALYSAARG